MAHRIVGQPIARIEGIDKVNGAARYTADVALPGLCWGKALRSPLPHARILRIDTSRASALAGVLAVLTARDLPDLLVGRRMFDMPVLARDRVRFVGEKVAVVAALDPDVAEEALGLIEVEYEDLPAVFDPVEAIKAGAPVLHDNPGAYDGAPAERPHPNVQSVLRFKLGDVEAGFREAHRVFEHTFTTPARAPGLPRAARGRGRPRRRRARAGVGLEQDAVPPEGAAVARAPAPARADPREPHADRRRLRRQGLAHGPAARLPPGPRHRPAGEDGHALHRGADGRQPAPSRGRHHADRRDAGRADRRPAGDGALQQRRLRGLQAGAQREPRRHRHGRGRLPDPEPADRRALRLHQQHPLRPRARRRASRRWSSPASRTWT